MNKKDKPVAAAKGFTPRIDFGDPAKRIQDAASKAKLPPIHYPSLPIVACKCGSMAWINQSVLKVVPAFAYGDNKTKEDAMFNAVVCAGCHKIHPNFNNPALPMYIGIPDEYIAEVVEVPTGVSKPGEEKEPEKVSLPIIGK